MAELNKIINQEALKEYLSIAIDCNIDREFAEEIICTNAVKQMQLLIRKQYDSNADTSKS